MVGGHHPISDPPSPTIQQALHVWPQWSSQDIQLTIQQAALVAILATTYIVMDIDRVIFNRPTSDPQLTIQLPGSGRLEEWESREDAEINDWIVVFPLTMQQVAARQAVDFRVRPPTRNTQRALVPLQRPLPSPRSRVAYTQQNFPPLPEPPVDPNARVMEGRVSAAARELAEEYKHRLPGDSECKRDILNRARTIYQDMVGLLGLPRRSRHRIFRDTIPEPERGAIARIAEIIENEVDRLRSLSPVFPLPPPPPLAGLSQVPVPSPRIPVETTGRYAVVPLFDGLNP